MVMGPFPIPKRPELCQRPYSIWRHELGIATTTRFGTVEYVEPEIDFHKELGQLLILQKEMIENLSKVFKKDDTHTLAKRK